MTQSDLFGPITRRGDSIVPPTREEIARHKRDRGIERAVTHADAVSKLWSERAYRWFVIYARTHAEFMSEQAREYAEANGLPAPSDKRAWGGVAQRALREGIVERIGYAPANSSNRSPKCLYRSKVCA